MIQSYGDSESVKKFNSLITTLKHLRYKNINACCILLNISDFIEIVAIIKL